MNNFEFSPFNTTIFNDYIFISNQFTVDSFVFKETEEGNFIEVVKREISPYNYLSQDIISRVYKEIYGITRGDNGKKILRLLRTIEGVVTPAHKVPESVEFPE